MVGKPLNVFHFCDILPFLIDYMVIQFLILVGLFLVCISNTRTAYLFPHCSICYQSVIAKWGSRPHWPGVPFCPFLASDYLPLLLLSQDKGPKILGGTIFY